MIHWKKLNAANCMKTDFANTCVMIYMKHVTSASTEELQTSDLCGAARKLGCSSIK